MGRIIDFEHQVKELSCLVRNLNNSNDEMSRAFAINKAQIILCQYKYDITEIDKYSVSQFFQALTSLLNKV